VKSENRQKKQAPGIRLPGLCVFIEALCRERRYQVCPQRALFFCLW